MSPNCGSAWPLTYSNIVHTTALASLESQDSLYLTGRQETHLTDYTPCMPESVLRVAILFIDLCTLVYSDRTHLCYADHL